MADSVTDGLEIEEFDRYIEARISGEFVAESFLDRIRKAVEACRARSKIFLHVDATRMEGLPTTLERFQLGEKGAAMAKGLKVAMSAPTGLIDPKKFGVVVARNRGLNVDIFADPEKAVAWLLAPSE